MFPHQNCFFLLDLFNLLLELWNLLAARNIRQNNNDWPGRPLLGGFQLRADVPPFQKQKQKHLSFCKVAKLKCDWL